MPDDNDRISESQDRTKPRGDSDFMNPARIYEISSETRCLDPTELARLEQSFRSWVEDSPRPDLRTSRKRILLIFLLIRYTGARLNEVLTLDFTRDLNIDKEVIYYGDSSPDESSVRREVHISSELMSEIRVTIDEGAGRTLCKLAVDAGHVRRKFYERASACGFAKELGSPNAIRRSRAVELMQNNVPLPVVQRMMGHSTPNLTASLMSFSKEDMHRVERHFVERESGRKTSARNTFFGKISALRRGDIQSQVELVTVGGDVLSTVITNDSMERLGLKIGSLITAEVKAPWVILQKSTEKPVCSAENILHGEVTHILRGKRTTEFTVRIQDGTDLCSLVTEESRRKLGIKEKDKVWIIFNSFAVIIRVD